MSENDETAHLPRQDSDDWLLPGTPHEESAPAEGSRFSRLLKPAALVVAGLIAGGGVVTAAQALTGDGASDGAVTAGAFDPRTGAPGLGDTDGNGFGGRGAPPAFDGGHGGLVGELRLTGTLTAVGSSTVTVTTSQGTATYQLTDSTQIVVDGQVAELADLTKGDQVFLHVYPSSTDADQLLVERIFAGDLPAAPGLPDGSDPDGDASSTT